MEYIHISEGLYLLVRVSMTNMHILSPLQKELDTYLKGVLGDDFKRKKYKKVEDIKWIV